MKLKKITAIAAALAVCTCTLPKLCLDADAAVNSNAGYKILMNYFINAYGSVNIEDGRYTGPFFMLLDFDNNGTDELFVEYGDKSSDGDYSGFYYEVYTLTNGSPVRVLGPESTQGIMNIDWMDFVYKNTLDNRYYIANARYDVYTGGSCWLFDFRALSGSSFSTEYKICWVMEGSMRSSHQSAGYKDLFGGDPDAATARKGFGMSGNGLYSPNIILNTNLYSGFDEETETAAYITMNAAVSASGVAAGDVNDDNEVNVSDAADALALYAKEAAGIAVDKQSSDYYAADIFFDTVVELRDAAAILKYYACNAAGINMSWAEILSE